MTIQQCRNIQTVHLISPGTIPPHWHKMCGVLFFTYGDPQVLVFFLVHNIQLNWLLMVLPLLCLEKNSRILITIAHKQILLMHLKYTIIYPITLLFRCTGCFTLGLVMKNVTVKILVSIFWWMSVLSMVEMFPGTEPLVTLNVCLPLDTWTFPSCSHPPTACPCQPICS